jgi:hypothetical protein
MDRPPALPAAPAVEPIRRVILASANERLVRFDFAGERHERFRFHRQADAVEHEPRGFLRTPSARPSSCDDAPFLVLASSQKAGSHFVNGIGESSKIVPTRTENCRLHSLQHHFFRVASACTSAEPHPWRGHATPLGQRIFTA